MLASPSIHFPPSRAQSTCSLVRHLIIMAPHPWATTEERAFLLSYLPEYEACQVKRKYKNFWMRVNKEYFNKFPVRDRLFPGIEGKDLNEEQKEQCGAMIAKQQKRIKEWYRWQMNPRSRNAGFTITKKDLHSIYNARTRTLKPYEVFAKLYPKAVEEAKKKKCDAEGIHWRQQLSAWHEVAKEPYQNATQAQLEAVRREGESDSNSEAEDASESPQNYLRYLKRLPTILDATVRPAVRKAGVLALVTIVGPDPEKGGKIVSRTLQFGDKTDTPLFSNEWAEHDTIFIEELARFARKYEFSSAVCAARSLESQGDPTSEEGVSELSQSDNSPPITTLAPQLPPDSEAHQAQTTGSIKQGTATTGTKQKGRVEPVRRAGHGRLVIQDLDSDSEEFDDKGEIDAEDIGDEEDRDELDDEISLPPALRDLPGDWQLNEDEWGLLEENLQKAEAPTSAVPKPSSSGSSSVPKPSATPSHPPSVILSRPPSATPSHPPSVIPSRPPAPTYSRSASEEHERILKLHLPSQSLPCSKKSFLIMDPRPRDFQTSSGFVFGAQSPPTITLPPPRIPSIVSSFHAEISGFFRASITHSLSGRTCPIRTPNSSCSARRLTSREAIYQIPSLHPQFTQHPPFGTATLSRANHVQREACNSRNHPCPPPVLNQVREGPVSIRFLPFQPDYSPSKQTLLRRSLPFLRRDRTTSARRRLPPPALQLQQPAKPLLPLSHLFHNPPHDSADPSSCCLSSFTPPNSPVTPAPSRNVFPNLESSKPSKVLPPESSETAQAPSAEHPRRSTRGPVPSKRSKQLQMIGSNVSRCAVSKSGASDDSAWFQSALKNVEAWPLGDAWSTLVEKWGCLEGMMGYGKVSRGSLPVKDRPGEWAKWTAKARQGNRPYDLIPEIDEPADLGLAFAKWWASIQPAFRSSSDTLPLPEYSDPNGEDKDPWTTLRKSGHNGFVSVIMLLGWWGCAATTGTTEWQDDSLPLWSRVVVDVKAVVDEMIRTFPPSPSEKVGKRKAEKAESGRATKRSRR
ncbi:hypothetical protein NMY22_g8373 [Coprinellus aureogranulatus]|nr:hypothetical protein NMY22_g8373 [Coprinellus aureogranulatus]